MAGVGSEFASAGSDSLKATHRNVQRIFNEEFRTSTPARQAAYPVWAQLSESQACDFKLYDDYAQYLAYEYLIKSNDPVRNHLAIGSVLDYLGALVQCAANRFKAAGGAETRQFFTCQDAGSSTDSGQWFRGLKDKIEKDLFKRAMENGEVIDHSATALCLPHTKAINQAYAREGSEEVCLLCASTLSRTPRTS